MPREEWADRGPPRNIAWGGLPRGRKFHHSHCGPGDRGAAGLRPDQAKERQGARVREQHVGGRRASYRSAHTRDSATQAKQQKPWRTERRLLHPEQQRTPRASDPGFEVRGDVGRPSKRSRGTPDREVATTRSYSFDFTTARRLTRAFTRWSSPIPAAAEENLRERPRSAAGLPASPSVSMPSHRR